LKRGNSDLKQKISIVEKPYLLQAILVALADIVADRPRENDQK
jgi:hypothetical protein